MHVSAAHHFCSAGELKPAEIDKVLDVIAKPEDYKVMLVPEAARAVHPCIAHRRLCCARLLFVFCMLTLSQIPRYFLNRQRDWKEGNSLQVSQPSLFSAISPFAEPNMRQFMLRHGFSHFRL